MKFISKISSHGISFRQWQKRSQKPSWSAQKQLKAMQWKGASPFEFEGNSTETETKWSQLCNRGKETVEQTIVLWHRNKSKISGQDCEHHSQQSD